MDCQGLITEFESKIDALEASNKDVLHMAEMGISYTESVIKTLQKEVVQTGFNSIRDEIHFFKHIKPQFFSKLIYFVKLFKIESKRPRSSAKFQIKYLNNQIHKLQTYFNDTLEFYHYYRRGSTALDEQYFVRGKSDLRLPSDSFHFFIDEQFSTSQDSTVATIMAYDMLIVYLQQEIEKLQSNDKPLTSKTMKPKSNVFWTGSKTQLIELIYALHASRMLNSGMVDIKEIAALFESIFNIDLGNYYHTFIEIRARKMSRTKFLDLLKEQLELRIDAMDE